MMRHRYIKALAALATSSVLAAAFSAPAVAAPGDDKAPVKIRIAQQPQRWGLEWYIATQKGWWKQVGLDPVMSTFSSGAPEIAAGASGSWDVGGAGNIPSVLGASRYGLQTIGLADGEAAIISIMATKDKADAYAKNPALLKGKTIPVTTNSTGHWGAAVCLEKKFGLKPDDYRFVNLSPSEINAAVNSGRYDVAQVWAPNTYILESTIGAKVICTGADVGLPITSNLFVTPAFAKENPDAVAKFLAVYLRAVAWQRANPKEAEAYLGAFFKSVGVNIPPEYLARELRDRPAYTLAEQLKIFDGGEKSQMADWWMQVSKFMESVGVVRKIPSVKDHVTNKYLLMIQNDPKLKAFAENTGD
ncbi:myristoyl transferase [Imbroritus primus]|uniref:Myristoyl transferase n=1 Tax=Imbroritus primus TaxID=3058603 RepID=A0ACD3SR33_9BURK|nr:myristoyl transferase [Burkholderiaceae bacterium PBA]